MSSRKFKPTPLLVAPEIHACAPSQTNHFSPSKALPPLTEDIVIDSVNSPPRRRRPSTMYHAPSISRRGLLDSPPSLPSSRRRPVSSLSLRPEQDQANAWPLLRISCPSTPMLNPILFPPLEVWTEEQTKNLVLACRSGVKMSWDEIAAFFPEKSASSCQKRFHEVQQGEIDRFFDDETSCAFAISPVSDDDDDFEIDLFSPLNDREMFLAGAEKPEICSTPTESYKFLIESPIDGHDSDSDSEVYSPLPALSRGPSPLPSPLWEPKFEPEERRHRNLEKNEDAIGMFAAFFDEADGVKIRGRDKPYAFWTLA